MLFIAARLNSTRLTKKVLKTIYGAPLLERLIERVSKNFLKHDIVVCSSINSEDDPIEAFCKNNQVFCFRGDELDVMKRFIDAAELYKAKSIARITGDNPLTDPEMLLHMFEMHKRNGAEYTYNEDMPIGTRAEIIDVDALKRIHKELYDPNNSEYMTYMLKRPDKINTLNVPSLIGKCSRPEISLTVDCEEDLQCLNHIYKFYEGNPPSLEKIIAFLDKNPNIKITINQESHKIPRDIRFSYKGEFN